MFAEHESVELTRDLPESGLVTGAHGAVVHVHAEGVAYEVEFVDDTGQTIAVETVNAADLRRRDRSAALSAAVEAGVYEVAGPLEWGPASDRAPRTAAALIAALSALPPDTLVLVQGYEGHFSPIDSISDVGPVQELGGDWPDYYGRFAHPNEASRAAAQRAGDPFIVVTDFEPPTLVGEPVQAVVLRRERG